MAVVHAGYPPRATKNEDAELAKAGSAFCVGGRLSIGISGTDHAHLAQRCDHRAALPGARVRVREPGNEVIADSPLFGVRQAHDQHACVLAGLELPGVPEIQVVGHEEAVFGLSRRPYVLVASTAELLIEHGIDVVPQGR